MSTKDDCLLETRYVRIYLLASDTTDEPHLSGACNVKAFFKEMVENKAIMVEKALLTLGKFGLKMPRSLEYTNNELHQDFSYILNDASKIAK